MAQVNKCGEETKHPSPPLRAPKPGCKLATAPWSCCHQAEPMDKPLASPILKNVLSVAKRLGVCRSTIHAWVQKGLFSPPIKLGRSSRWLTSEVNDWVTLQARTRKSS
ncbi:helix-turn-helix transcriptional regulator [Pseudoxanthomonas beigongshangi]